MKLNSNNLIQELELISRQNLAFALQLDELSLEDLQQRPAPGSWNVLECLEHLNRYGKFYLPEIAKQLTKSTATPADQFSPGLLGNYFANSMRPTPTTKKIKTFKTMNPLHAALDHSVIDEFIRQQKELLKLLTQARSKNLNKIKTAISISKLVKLKMGDTLRFVIYHNQRHVEQAQRIVQPTSEKAMV